MLVRPATSADAAAIARLQGLSASTRRSLARDLDRSAGGEATAPVALAAVGTDAADRDAEVVGAALGLLQHDEGHVLDLAVAPAWRRRGVGTRLLRALVDALLARGARAVTLEVRAGDLGAQALYRAEGFAVEGRRPGYYPDGDDALLLWWRPDTAACAHLDHASGTGTGTAIGTGTGTGTTGTGG